MKKLFSLILAVIVFALAVPANAATHGYLRGDVNDDGTLSMKDVLAIRRLLAGDYTEADAFTLAADVDGDGSLTMKDVLKLRKIIAGAEDAEGNNTDGEYKVSEIKIGGRNIARFTIVIPDEAPEGAFLPSVQFAAEELRDNIKGACGVDLNISFKSTADYAK